MKLNQVLAVERATKTRFKQVFDGIDKSIQKPDFFSGHSKTYQPVHEDGDTLPAESQKVQLRVADLLQSISSEMTRLIDHETTLQVGNTVGRANVVVEGQTLVTDAPVSLLLSLEKAFVDLHTVIGRLPVLDNQQDWIFDSGSGLFRTDPVKTIRQRKVQKPLVLYPATAEHPAQTQIITEDELAGYWSKTLFSGAVTQEKKRALTEKCHRLIMAIKTARESANSVDVEDQKAGQALLDYVLT